jgi:hypothetical protein
LFLHQRAHRPICHFYPRDAASLFRHAHELTTVRRNPVSPKADEVLCRGRPTYA